MADSKYSAYPVVTPASTDLVAGIQNGANVNYRFSSFAAASSSAGTTTTTTSTSSTVLNVLSYGAKNDGVILNDITVSSGSKSVSSSSNPFTSTAVDAGKLVIWLTGATLEVGTIATVQSASQATLVANAVAGSVAYGGPNSNGAIGTDNTAAFNSVFTAAQSASALAGSNRNKQTPAPEVHLPAGVYLTKALNTMTQRNVLVRGDGQGATFIASALATSSAGGTLGPIITLSNFSTNGNIYDGTADGWKFRDLAFVDPCRWSYGTEGQRQLIAVQDNGGGATEFENVLFVGCKYGFVGAYGSDFSSLRYCYFFYCDTGSYFGPGSQQVDFYKVDFSGCREGAVFEGAPHWHMGACSFEDATVAAIHVKAKSSGQTDFNQNPQAGGAFYNGNFIIDGGTWFETNSGGLNRVSPRIVWLDGDGPFNQAVAGLVLRDAYLISGGGQVSGGTNTFLEVTSAITGDEHAYIDGLYVSDPSYINSIVRSTGTAAASVRADRVRKPTNVAYSQGGPTVRYIDRSGKLSGFTVS